MQLPPVLSHLQEITHPAALAIMDPARREQLWTVQPLARLMDGVALWGAPGGPSAGAALAVLLPWVWIAAVLADAWRRPAEPPKGRYRTLMRAFDLFLRIGATGLVATASSLIVDGPTSPLSLQLGSLCFAAIVFSGAMVLTLMIAVQTVTAAGRVGRRLVRGHRSGA